MRGLLWKGLAVAALVAAVIVPAASATSSAKVKMSVLPLPQSALGSSAKSLAIYYGSGVVSNTAAAGNSWTGTPKTFTQLGRISGYSLVYGDAVNGGAGVTSVSTQVDQYKTAAGAKKGLAFWKQDDPHVAQLSQAGFAVTSMPVKVPAVGSARFADLVSYSDANIAPVWTLDEHFTDGRYELQVVVWAGSAAGATKLAPALAKKLDARLRAALKGRLHATPAKLPKLPPAGPPAGGPDLSALALKTTDLRGSATITDQRYYVDPGALSDYSTFMQPAGPFDLLDQEVEWYPTANEASWWADWSNAQYLAAGGKQLYFNYTSVGDGAQGGYDQQSLQAATAEVVFSTGHLAEFILMGRKGPIQGSDIVNTAQAAANYINNAGLGS